MRFSGYRGMSIREFKQNESVIGPNPLDIIVCLFVNAKDCPEKETKMRRIQQISYDSNRILGKGAFGVVFPGTIASTDGQVEISVAVKRVTIENINKREEIALNTLMDHPNVIKLFHTEQNQDFK